MRSIPLRAAGDRVRRVEAKLGSGDAVVDVDAMATSFAQLPASAREAGRVFWSQRAWSEYAAIPAIGNVLVKGVGERASLDESAAFAAVIRDETEHTRLAQRVAEALGGYRADVDDELSFDPYAFVEQSSLPRIADVVLAGCLGETVSRAMLRASLDFTKEGALRDIVERVHRDEYAHTALAWAVASEQIPLLDDDARAGLAQLVAPHVKAARDGTLSRARTQRAHATQAKLFDDVAAASLGCAPATVVEDAIARVFAIEIVPSLARLGVHVDEHT